MEEVKGKKEDKKGFWARLMDRLDKKMEEQAKKGGCCCCSGSREQSKENKC